MNRDDMMISLHCGMTVWHWTVTDLQGDHVAHGSDGDYAVAAQQAREALDAAVGK